MPIITSAHTVGHAQRNGWSYVRETHIDDAGRVYSAEYLAAPETDYAAILTARAAQINAALAEAEATELSGGI